LKKIKKTKRTSEFVITFFSKSGFNSAKKYSDAKIVTFLPFDRKKELNQFITKIRPKILLLIKNEFWPNLIKCVHKADIKILINKVDAKQILSRGEQKILSILWCCSQNEVLRKKYNIDATLIIDDIKSELDDSTFEVFLNLLSFLENQVIFSCIDDHFSSKIKPIFKDFKKFHVEQLR
jgi:hypothetical protein